MASDLITATELKTYLNINHSDDDTLLDALIDGVSAAIEVHSGHFFSSSSVVEYVDGGASTLVLKRRPVTAVKSVVDVLPHIEVLTNPDFQQNSDGWTVGSDWAYDSVVGAFQHVAGGADTLSTALDATAEILYLVRVHISSSAAAGVLSVSVGDSGGDSLIGAGVLDQLITTTGGTDALVLTPSTSSAALVESVSVLDATDRYVEAGTWSLDSSGGRVVRTALAGGDYWFSDHPTRHARNLVWAGGTRRFRVAYVGGESSVPEDVKLAAKLWCAALYTRRDQGAIVEIEGDRHLHGEVAMPTQVRALLSSYREVSF